jgi:hypothetical protein
MKKVVQEIQLTWEANWVSAARLAGTRHTSPFCRVIHVDCSRLVNARACGLAIADAVVSGEEGVEGTRGGGSFSFIARRGCAMSGASIFLQREGSDPGCELAESAGERKAAADPSTVVGAKRGRGRPHYSRPPPHQTKNVCRGPGLESGATAAVVAAAEPAGQ